MHQPTALISDFEARELLKIPTMVLDFMKGLQHQVQQHLPMCWQLHCHHFNHVKKYLNYHQLALQQALVLHK